MISWQDIPGIFSRGIDCVASIVVGLLERLIARRVVRLVEREPGRIVILPDDASARGAEVVLDLAETARSPSAVLRGCRAQLHLNPERILFRPLELPARATEFIYGIVRAQIDRLMPWRADEAVFGWSEPVEAGANRIMVTVAATARSNVAPYLQALAAQGARHITISTTPPAAEAVNAPVVLLEQSLSSMLDFNRVRQAAFVLLIAVVGGGALTTVASTLFAAGLQTRYEENTHRIAELRARARAGATISTDATTDALNALENRKLETPSSVLVLESLSRSLPDHSYVTELRIEGKRVQVIGVTRDAASLIHLIEESGHFTRATFFAPTTRIASNAGERFHIEAQVDPAYRPQ